MILQLTSNFKDLDLRTEKEKVKILVEGNVQTNANNKP